MNNARIPFRPSRLSRALSLAFAGSLATGVAFAQDGITDLGALNGGTYSEAYGISADGSVVVGVVGDGAAGNVDQAFRWTAAGGMVNLGVLNGGLVSKANGVSVDGAVVVGYATDGHAGDAQRAFRWTQAGGMVSLGTLNSGSYSYATGVSADGAVVVGVAVDGNTAFMDRAFRWTQADGLVSLGTLNGSSLNSMANAVNADGSVVVGEAADGAAGVNHAFRWTQAGGMVSLGDLNAVAPSLANGVSADGSVVVGWAADSAAGNAQRAFRWTQADGMVSLGVLGGSYSDARGVSADGLVVVGQADDSSWNDRAFRWTQATGMQTVEDWLRAAGVTVAKDITYHADATNSDGSVVVGTLESGYAFIARVSPVGSGLVTLADVQDSLAGTARGGSVALTTAGTEINGAHSHPLMRRVATGQKTFWVAGDCGRDDHGARDGDLGLAEVGFGRNFGAAQINVSLGQTRARQNQRLGGSTQVDGTYLLTEALIPVRDNLWAVLGGYGHWGTTDIRRGYLNAGVQDYSTGKPDVTTWGLRGRLEWDGLYQIGGAALSPYADLTYTESRLAAYTETGGGFPASYSARTEPATELRLGIDGAKPLGNGVTLTGVLEAAHRFETNGARTSGQVLGLFAFNLGGEKNQQDWLRVGAGLEGKLAGGKASLFLNLTTRGETPSAWLAANWQKTF